MYRYLTNCVNSNDGPGITAMADAARPITWRTFRQHVPVDEVRWVFPFYSYQQEHYNPDTGELTAPMHIKDDYAVGFYKSTYRGKRCYYIRHSGIEYIWTEATR